MSWPTTSSRRRRADDLAKAIDYAQRAGEQDMEQLAYEDAVDVYGRALEVLELMDEPDEALRCSLLLSLGGAEAKSARVADAREAFERAAESARRLDDNDSLVGAAIGIAMMSDAGRLDEKLLALLDEALERIGPERTARRAALLSAKSAEMYWVDNDLSESTRLVDEAIEIAREIDAPTHPGRGSAAQDLHPDRPGRRPRAARDRRGDARARGGLRRPRGRPARATATGSGVTWSSGTSRRSTAS